MSINSRSGQLSAYRTAERHITQMFDALIERMAGVLLAEANRDGVIPLNRLGDTQNAARAAVEAYFVTRRVVDAVDAQGEREHLDNLLELARKELKDASEQTRVRVQARLARLTERYTLLTNSGVALTAFVGGQPATRYAQIIFTGAEQAVNVSIDASATGMVKALDGAGDVEGWLRTASGGAGGQLPPSPGSVLGWADSRGYRLSDRIWNVNEATAARIDRILADGIRQGRSAVDMAKDLETFLKPSRRTVKTLKPYGTQGSFDARRLARTEITRAHAVATHESGLSNPFVMRARWHMSRSHSPRNCDGSCDQHYADDQANNGFEPGSAPIPVIDTHPQCLCYVTHETGNVNNTIMELRNQMGMSGQSAPFTPLTADFGPWLMGTTQSYANARG